MHLSEYIRCFIIYSFHSLFSLIFYHLSNWSSDAQRRLRFSILKTPENIITPPGIVLCCLYMCSRICLPLWGISLVFEWICVAQSLVFDVCFVYCCLSFLRFSFIMAFSVCFRRMDLNFPFCIFCLSSAQHPYCKC